MNRSIQTLKYRTALAAAALFLMSQSASAAVDDVGTSGFQVRENAQIAATPDKVYAAVLQPAKWWSSDHTFSQNAANLTLDAKAGGCWCEKLPDGGTVQHMIVVYAQPGKVLRLRGALGPFQGMAVDGALTIAMKANGAGTDVSLTYAIGGYSPDGFVGLARAADATLGTQLDRLKEYVEQPAK